MSKITKNQERRLSGKMRCKMVAVGGPFIEIRKGFVCWEAPTTNTFTVAYDNLDVLAQVRLAFIADLEAEGYVRAAEKGLLGNSWLLEQDGLFYYVMVEPAFDAHTEFRFDVSPFITTVRQR